MSDRLFQIAAIFWTPMLLGLMALGVIELLNFIEGELDDKSALIIGLWIAVVILQMTVFLVVLLALWAIAFGRGLKKRIVFAAWFRGWRMDDIRFGNALLLEEQRKSKVAEEARESSNHHRDELERLS